ncbi:MAG TPA: VWA domain-containing protein, partial [Candidatus Latescibacteria bacterium]|nr:VWA domain-containing protein [Candidatus Latescibacterota bacterium]
DEVVEVEVQPRPYSVMVGVDTLATLGSRLRERIQYGRRFKATGEAEVAREVSPPASAGGREWLDGLRALGYGGDVDDGRRREALKLSAEELHDQADRHTKRIYLECRRRPGESPRDMFFRFWGDNPFVATGQDRLSTFAADVDTASYALARRYLEGGQLPTKAQIRTEEFVNYAKPDLPSPSEAALAIHTELAPSLFGGKQGRMMLRVGIRGQEVSATERKPLSLTFAIDVSGSMKEGRRLELVKHAIRLLVGQLHEGDKVGFVAYSREARMLLPMTDASERGLIESALHPLSPNGGTNAEAGLKMAYELAFAALDPAAHSRVILLSDGVANIGTTDQDRINQDVTR